MRRNKEQLYLDMVNLDDALNEKTVAFDKIMADYEAKSEELKQAYDDHSKLSKMYNELVNAKAKMDEAHAEEKQSLKNDVIRLTDQVRVLQSNFSVASKNIPLDLVKTVNDIYAMPDKEKAKKIKLVPFKTVHIFEVRDDSGKVCQTLRILIVDVQETKVKGLVTGEWSVYDSKQFLGQLVFIDKEFLQHNQTWFEKVFDNNF